MGEIIQAIVLGIIQGLTEFLPVSSSGHLELAKYFLGDQSVGEESMLMTVTLHAATALSTIVVFRKDIAEILRGIFPPHRAKQGEFSFGNTNKLFQWNEETQFAVKIILSMIPAAVVGVLFEEKLEALFDRQILLVAAMLIVTGLLLFLADRAKDTQKSVSMPNAFIIGIAQMVAMLPGISRSGATISTSVLLGIDRGKAARFSFLMVVPLILGKIAKDILDGAFQAPDVNLVALGVGFAAAFFTGLVACTWMIKLVKASKLSYFSYYCFAVAIFAIVVYFVQQ